MSSGAGFPINDLLRRKLQTSLTVTTLTLSVASTLFLLFFSNRLGVGILSSTVGTLTLGLRSVFGQFIVFIGALIFIIGAVLTSFIVFLMMSQRTRDFGLIKAAGCPNSLIGGYFMTELLTITFIGCLLGIAFGFLADFIVSETIFSAYTLPNFWYSLIVFVVFFALALFFGLRPIIKAAKVSAIEALSSMNYYGLIAQARHKAFSKRGITWRIAIRSLYRRETASIRIIFLLTIIFILLTVSIAGGTIANETTIASIEGSIGKDAVVIGQPAIIAEYKLQLSKFSKPQMTSIFNYSDQANVIPQSLINELENSKIVSSVDSRLILDMPIKEIAGISLGSSTADSRAIGGFRQGQAIIIGINPSVAVGSWSVKGQFLNNNSDFEAVIGDSIANTLYIPDISENINLSDPLLEGIGIGNRTFKIIGVCTDPLNNGYVVYVPIDQLQSLTEIHWNNLLFVELDDSTERNVAIEEIATLVEASGLEVFDLNYLINQNTSFLSSTWQAIQILPLITLASASLCLVGYMMLSVDEQRQEFAILRAIGAKPSIIVNISAIQVGFVLFFSFGVGITLGTMITMMILMANPVITVATVLVICTWLIAALIAMFALSLYPAIRQSKASILGTMT